MGLLDSFLDVATGDFAKDVVYPGLLSLYSGNRQSKAVSNAGQQAIAGMQKGAGALQSYAQKGLNALGQQYDYGRATLTPYSEFGVDGLVGYSQLMDDPSSITANPGYQFRLQQGEEALNRSAAARRGLLSGGQLLGLQEYGQQYAMDEYDRALKRNALQIETGLRGANTLADLSQAYGRGVSGIYEGLGTGLSGIYGDIGSTQGASTLGQQSAMQGQLGDILNIWQQYRKGKGLADLISGAQTGYEGLATAGGGNPFSAIYGEGGVLSQAGKGTWGDLLTGPNSVSGLSSLYAAPGSAGEFAAFSDAPFEMLSEYGIGAEGAAGSTAGGKSLLSSVSPALKALGIAGAVFGGVKFLDSINWGKGGSSETAKLPKFNKRLQNALKADPTGVQFEREISSLVNGKMWAGENNNWVIQHLIDNGVIDYDYAKLHDKNSVYNIWDISPDKIAKNYEWKAGSGRNPLGDDYTRTGWAYKRGADNEDFRASTKDTIDTRLIQAAQGAYGLSDAQTKEYKRLVSLTNKGPRDNEDIGGTFTVDQWRQAVSQREAFEKKYLTEARKRRAAQNLRAKIRSRGYTGNLQKINSFLGSKG